MSYNKTEQSLPPAEGAEKVQRCPVCGGNGLVPNGFYNQTSGQWTSCSTLPEKCRTCNGAGVIILPYPKLQPTAEGADVIASLIESLGEPTEVHNHSYSIRPYTVEGKTEWWMFHDGVGSGEPLAQWLSEFATLHAQQMAKKMVREELIAYDKYASRWIDNYRAETAEDCVDEYLKSKEQ